MAKAGFAEATADVIVDLLSGPEKRLQVPATPHVDLAGVQKSAVKANLDILPTAEELAGKVDAFNIDELFKQLEKFSPGISKAIGKIPGILSDELSGVVPDDVRREIQRGVGSKAWQLGLSPAQRASLSAEAIGQTSYSIQQQGVTAASRWLQQIESSAPRFNFASMFVTPAQEAATEAQNEVWRFNTQMMRNKLAIMPSRLEQDYRAAAEGFGSIIDSVGSTYLGGVTGGGGGGMGSMMKGMGGGGGGSSGGGGGTQFYDYSSPTDSGGGF